MDQQTHEELMLKIDEIIDTLTDHEDLCLVPIELAHQLRDELHDIIPEDEDE